MSVNCDPNALMEAARCFRCIPPGMQQEVITYLLCQIAQGGGGGGNCGWVWGPDQTIYDNITISGDPNVKTISFPTLVTLGPVNGFFFCVGCTSLTDLDLPALVSAIGTVDFSTCVALTKVNLPMLTTVGISGFSCSGCPSLTVLSLPSLITCSGILNLGSCLGLATLNLPVLSSVGGGLSFFNCFSLTTLDLPALISVTGGAFDGDTCTILTTINLPVLTTIGGNFLCNGCTALTTVDVSQWVPTDGTTITFNGDALNAASVELILRRCVLAGVTTCTIDLSGGTNAGLASLSVQGQADYATLFGAGNAIILNP